MIDFHNSSFNPAWYSQLYLNDEKITELNIPYGIKKIKQYSFNGFIDIVSVKIPNSVISVEDYSFYNCKDLRFVTLGTGINKIGKHAFASCASLKTINSYAETPPEIFTDTFSDYEASLHIPKGSKDDYQLTSYWYLFNNMTDDLNPSDGVEEIDSDITDEPMEIFDMNGIKVGASTEVLTPGFYILKQGGNVKKIGVN